MLSPCIRFIARVVSFYSVQQFPCAVSLHLLPILLILLVLSFLAFVFFFLSYFFFCVVFVFTLPLELCTCPSGLFSAQQATYRIGNRVYYWVWLRSIIDPPPPPWEDECEWRRMTIRVTRPDCAVMCNLNTHTHTLGGSTRVA